MEDVQEDIEGTAAQVDPEAMRVIRGVGQGVVQVGVIGAITGISAKENQAAVPPAIPESLTAGHTANPKNHIVDLDHTQSQDHDQRVVTGNQ
jgi:hypothetical protein